MKAQLMHYLRLFVPLWLGILAGGLAVITGNCLRLLVGVYPKAASCKRLYLRAGRLPSEPPAGRPSYVNCSTATRLPGETAPQERELFESVGKTSGSLHKGRHPRRGNCSSRLARPVRVYTAVPCTVVSQLVSRFGEYLTSVPGAATWLLAAIPPAGGVFRPQVVGCSTFCRTDSEGPERYARGAWEY